ncbi:MAG: thiolase family protein [Symbiobacteriaceae bacterium]|nr:MAG: 3-oxoadipyl-CoA thiolase [Bacillota bacterium]
MPEPVIVSAVRTPIGRHGGALAPVRPDDLAAIAIRAAVERAGVDPATIEDVVLGCANQAGEDNRNVARMAALLAGLPEHVAGVTVNRLCGSGLEAVLQAARAIRAGEGDTFVAGGVESMSRAPWVMPKPERGYPRGNVQVYDTTLGWRFVNPRLAAMFPPESMGETAENVAERYGIGREVQDRFALASQHKWAAAQAAGKWREEIVPVEVERGRGEKVVVEVDEHPRPDTTLEKLAALPPAFRPGGTVTAGNSSGLNDGAAALVIMADTRARELGLRPLARIVAGAVVGVDPRYMGIGPVPATRKALARAGWSVADLDLVELNEAFAAQVLACIRELELPEDIVNVNGGAIAMGHPLGCSGARILTTLVHEMRRRGARRGLATMCIGVGQGIAALVEAVE